MTIESRLAEIRARVEAASNEPWLAEDRNLDEPWSTTVVYNVFHNGDTPDRDLVAEAAYDNAEFIAASRADIPWLLGQVELRDKALEAVMDLHAADEDGDCAECIRRAQGRGDQSYPCLTVTALTAALEVQG